MKLMGESTRAMARVLSRPASTISRELHRNNCPCLGYTSDSARAMHALRRLSSKLPAKLDPDGRSGRWCSHCSTGSGRPADCLHTQARVPRRSAAMASVRCSMANSMHAPCQRGFDQRCPWPAAVAGGARTTHLVRRLASRVLGACEGVGIAASASNVRPSMAFDR